MRWMLLAIVGVGVLVCVPWGEGLGDGPDKKLQADNDRARKLMHQKLDLSQKVLAGLALDDCEKIARNAAELMVLSKKVEWNVVKTPQYELHSNEFRRSLESLQRHGEKKNLDAAALAYVEMTLTCVRCHKYVREIRMTRLDGKEQTHAARAPAAGSGY